MVCPLKTYISGQTTVTMCKLIMGNVDLIKALMYTTPPVIPNKLLSQINSKRDGLVNKAVYFNKRKKGCDAIHLGEKGQFEGKISSRVVGAYKKGVDKMRTLMRNCKAAFQIFDITF